MKKTKNTKQKKKLRLWQKLLLALFIIVAVLGIAVAALSLNLLNRINRPGDVQDGFVQASPEITPEPTDEAPHMTPTPTRTPAPVPTAAADILPTPTPEPLPLSEYREQTILTEEQLALFEQHNSDERYINVLLIGADRRAEKGRYNADTMMVATVDTVNGRLKLTTLMRDMLVNVPGFGYRKLNSTVALGGVELLYQTIEENLHLRLSDYVMVDLHSFVEVVDAIGGVTVEMSAEEISAANDCIAGLNKQLGVEYTWDGFIFAEEGPVQLTGKQALGYARIRKLDSEFVRTGRQFQILNMVFAKARKLNVSAQYDLLYKMLPFVETSMTNEEIISAATKVLSIDTKGLLYFRVPVEGYFENGKWEKHFVFFSDLPGMSIKLHEFIFDSDQKPKEAQVLTPNPSLPPRTPSPFGPATTDEGGQNTGGLFGNQDTSNFGAPDDDNE